MTDSVQTHIKDTHPTDLQLSMHADGALSIGEALEVDQHLPNCTLCRGKVASLQDEIQIIASALKLQDAESPEDLQKIVVPKFSRPASLREFALANVTTALLIWLAGFLWKTIFGELVMNTASWITSIYAPDVYEVTSATALYYLQEGTAMLDAYLGFIVFSFIGLTVTWLLLKYRRNRQLVSLGLMLLVGGTLIVPAPVNALEVRRDEGFITITEDEVIDDTLFAAAETVLVRGDVHGDLVVVGRRVEVDGAVAGNLVSFAETVTIRGSVGGLVLGAGSKFELEGAKVAGDVWAAGENVTIDRNAQVSSNVTVAGQKTIVEGAVGKDLYSFAEIVELSGKLGQDLEAFGEQVRLLDGAEVGGDARLRIPNEEKLHRAAAAVINGNLEFLEIPDEFRDGSRYSSGEFYLWQIARIVSAIIAGVLLLWLFPGFRTQTVSGGVEGLKTAGIGLVTLVSVPIFGVLIAITLVGIPISFFGILAWLILIYFAKIVVGAFIGRMMLRNTKFASNIPLLLLAGITAVIVVVNIPIVGGFISFVLTIVGIGLIVQRLFRYLSSRDSAVTMEAG